MAKHAVGYDAIVGRTLAHYLIEEKIGAGGMGVVYRARDQHLDREVAVKLLPPGTLNDDPSRKRFRKEALALSRLNHPNIATIHDFDTRDGVDFLVMEYIAGTSVAEKLHDGPLPQNEVVRLGTEIAAGLSAAHDRGVIHRDLKPGNVLLTEDGRLKILDFGLAKLLPLASAVTESLGETHALAGTLPYMAPEQVECGMIDGRTDVYAAGTLLFEMATGQHPFGKLGAPQWLDAILHQPPIPAGEVKPGISAELARILAKCLEKDPCRRYQSAKELEVDLHRLRTQLESSAGRRAPVAAARPAARSRSFTLALAGIFVVALVAAGWLWSARHSHAEPAGTISIAVLPFDDLSLNHDQQYFSDGLAEELLNSLTKVSRLRVAARNSAFQFKGRSEDLGAIGRKLNVAYVLEGSVRREGNRVRITVHLAHAEDGVEVWSQTFDRDLQDIFAVQSDIANSVASALQLKLQEQDVAGLSPPSKTTDMAAYEALLQARYFSHMDDEQSEKKALHYADAAIQSEPKYAPAYALRASIALQSGGWLFIDPQQAVEQAQRDTATAIALDPQLADAYRVLSKIQSDIQSDCPAAEKTLQRALELAPGDPDNLEQSALLNVCQGRLSEAAEGLRKEISIDPLRPLAYFWLGQVLLQEGRLEEARAEIAKAIDLSPDHVYFHEIQAEIFLAQGRAPEALAETEKERASWARDFGQALAQHALGREAESNAALDRLVGQHPNEAGFQIAQVHGYRGEPGAAFQWLALAHRMHDPGLLWFRTDWKFQSLRGDPRYRQLMAKLHQPQ